MPAINAQILLNGLVEKASADNAIATATAPAMTSQRNFALGVLASYDAAVALYKTITITYNTASGTTVTLVFDHDFTNGEFAFAFPVAVRGFENTLVSAALEASGTGGINGKVFLFYFVS